MLVTYERYAAVDIGKDVIAAAVRMPGDGPDGRVTAKRTYKTFYGVLAGAARWLMPLGVTRVAMEATGIYPMPVCHALTGHGDFERVLACNAGHVKNVPGRKTGPADAEWPAQLPEYGLLADSFIPPADVKAVRDAIRYRAKITRQRAPEIARPGNVPQDTGIKIDSAASPVAPEPGRLTTGALTGGERRGAVLADLAKGKTRRKIPDLPMALEGRPGNHHALMRRLHPDLTGHLDKTIAAPGARIKAMMQPFRAARDLLITIPGAPHPASWAGTCPGSHESAGKRSSGRHRHGNQHLQPVLARCARAAVRHDGYLKPPCHRHVMKRGGYRSPDAKARAIIVVAHALLTIIRHVLATGQPCDDPGEDYLTRRQDPARETLRLIAKLKAPGHRVTLEAAA